MSLFRQKILPRAAMFGPCQVLAGPGAGQEGGGGGGEGQDSRD